MTSSHIQTRLQISIAITAIAAGALLAYVLIGDAQDPLEQFRQTQAIHQARTLAMASVDGLAAEDYELLTRWTNAAIPVREYAYAALCVQMGAFSPTPIPEWWQTNCQAKSN